MTQVFQPDGTMARFGGSRHAQYRDAAADPRARRVHRRASGFGHRQEADQAPARSAQGPAPSPRRTRVRGRRSHGVRSRPDAGRQPVRGRRDGRRDRRVEGPRLGTVKRHHFRRGPETHGSDSHRQPGSIGAGTYPGKVFKGTGMAGRMGSDRITVKKATVVKSDARSATCC